MNLIKSTALKLMRTNWVLLMVASPILYGLLLYWYLGRYNDNDPELILFSFATYYNCLLPTGISLLISLYVQYEEQIGHYNHLLQLPRRDKWLVNIIFFTWFSVGISTVISSMPLWLLVTSPYNKLIMYYILLTTLFSFPIIVILWFSVLKINLNLCLGIGITLSLFMTLFGANSLGDTIWMYIPFLYGARYLHVINMSYEPLFFILSMFFLISTLSLAFIIWWFNRWEGRAVNE